MKILMALSIALFSQPSANECRADDWIRDLSTLCVRLHQSAWASITRPASFGLGPLTPGSDGRANVSNPQRPDWATYAYALGEPRVKSAYRLVFDGEPVGGPGAACEVSVLRHGVGGAPALVSLTSRPGSGQRPRARAGCEHWGMLTELEHACRSVQPLSRKDFGLPEASDFGRSGKSDRALVFLGGSRIGPEDLRAAFGTGRDLGDGRWVYTRSPATFEYGGRCDAVAEVEDNVVRSVELVASSTPGQHVFAKAHDSGQVRRLREAVRARPQTAAELATFGIRGRVFEYGGELRIRIDSRWVRMSSLVAAFGSPEIRAELTGDRATELAEYPVAFAHFNFDGCHVTAMVGSDLLGRMTDRVLDPGVECPTESENE